MIDPDRFLNPTFKGKRVALIGPAPHIVKHDIKADLRNVDYVCRVNQALPLPDTVKAMTTDRCEVLYTTCDIPPQGWEKVQEVRVRAHNFWGIQHHKLLPELKPFYKKIQVLHPKYAWGLWEEVGCRPNTGFSAILNILSEEPKELRIYGCTFHRGKVYAPYYTRRKGSSRVQDHQGFVDQHDPDKQLRYFIKHVYLRDDVWVDPELLKICSEEYRKMQEKKVL